MSSIYKALKPILFTQDPEKIHHIVSNLSEIVSSLPGSKYLLKPFNSPDNPKLSTSIANLKLTNPVGLAAGFDKNAKLPKFFAQIGFGFMEIGSVTNEPASGNAKPRMFRLSEDKALINRLGLNNEGAIVIAKRLQNLILPKEFVCGVNIAKTNSQTLVGKAAEDDVVRCYQIMKDRGAFHVLNISCPNTEDGKTFEDPAALKSLLSRIAPLRSTIPLFVKFSPDLEDSLLLEDIKICEEFQVNGFVLCNTTSKRDNLKTSSDKVEAYGRGGLSGDPLFERMITRLSLVRKNSLPHKSIIAVGGIDSAEKAFKAITHGANAIEMYTGLVYEGPAIARRINEGLVRLLDERNIKSINEAVGIDVA